ncbi:MAG: dihydrolipoamide acetyltransferase family protein [Chloroflexota bacterium]
MATSIIMPQLGESVAEGVVARWLKQRGDHVEQDEPICEIVTDKVSAELPSPAAGVLAEILVAEGATVNVGAELGRIEAAAVADQTQAAPAIPEEARAAPTAASAGLDLPPAAGGAGGAAAEAANPDTGLHRAPGLPGRYSPAVRHLAEEHNLDLSLIQGTGQGGRVSKEDVLRYLAQRETSAAPPAPSAATPAAAPPAAPVHQVGVPAAPSVHDEVVPLSPVRRMIAEHMVRSKHEVPHATTCFEVDMARVVAWRERARERFRACEQVDLTYLPVMLRATAEALKKNPMLNAMWTAEGIVIKKDVNIGIAVSLEDGLIVPVIRHADRKDLPTLAREANDLAARARAKRLAVNDVQGGTFTLNNPGVFGTVVSSPIVNYPQVAILSMEGIAKRPVVVEGDAIAIRPMMYICLAFDHRVMDGLQAARFLQTVKAYLESFDGAREWAQAPNEH